VESFRNFMGGGGYRFKIMIGVPRKWRTSPRSNLSASNLFVFYFVKMNEKQRTEGEGSD
jgi:hypothetical protein